MRIDNVRDSRHGGRIGSWEIEPLVYDDLKPEDVGRTVIYQDSRRAYAGTLSSWRNGLVFARYTSGGTGAAAAPSDLSFAVGDMT